MQETIDVSIAGISFRLDTGAYALLKEYLDCIEQGYKDDPDGGEILADIEARICELILNEQEDGQPVPVSRVRCIIDQMGMPDDLRESLNPVPESSEKLSRRLYRSSEGAKLGGVCSGLAIYFNVEPVMVRLLFLVPLLFALIFNVGTRLKWLSDFSTTLFSVSIPLYLLLWFAIPKAKTPRQKLEMRGEKITASSIRQSFTSDFKDSAPDSPKSEQSASIWAAIVYILGRITLFVIKFVGGCVAAVLSITAISILLGIFVVLFDTPVNFMINGYSWADFLPGSETAVVLALLLVALLLGRVAIMLWRLLSGESLPKRTLTILDCIAAIIMIFLLVMSVRHWEEWRDAGWNSPGRNRIEITTPNRNQDNHSRNISGHDSTWVEEIKVSDSIIYDTVRIEYFNK